MMKKIELLSPAGSLEKLKFALWYGADAVYIGGKNYSLRANATNFTIEEIKEACKFAHELEKKVYITVNIVFHNEDIKELENYLKTLDNIGVDAIIISDLFIIPLAKKIVPNLKIHISTQLSVLNYETINFLKKYDNVERVVLGRELSKEEIQEIIEKTKIDTETFIHGAMCAGYSGRCVLSNYWTNRDANRGGCAQICRFEFKLCDNLKKEIQTESNFTMSCKDLCMINNIKSMIDIGIKSLKIEGRMRSNYYIATVVHTYKNILQDIENNTLTIEKQKYYEKILNKCANRDSISQFFDKFPSTDAQYYLGREESSNQDFLGIVKDYNEKTKEVTITERNFFKPGDIVQIFGPSTNTITFKVPNIYDEFNNILDAARHPEEIIKFKLNEKVSPNDILRIKI